MLAAGTKILVSRQRKEATHRQLRLFSASFVKVLISRSSARISKNSPIPHLQLPLTQLTQNGTPPPKEKEQVLPPPRPPKAQIQACEYQKQSHRCCELVLPSSPFPPQHTQLLVPVLTTITTQGPIPHPLPKLPAPRPQLKTKRPHRRHGSEGCTARGGEEG